MKLYDLYLLTVIGLVKIADFCWFFRLDMLLTRAIVFAAYHLSGQRGHLRELGVSRKVQSKRAETRRIVEHSIYVFWHDLFVASSPTSRQKYGRDNKPAVRGMEYLKEAQRKGRGVILWESSFFGGRILAKRILHENGVSVCQVHSECHVGGLWNTRTKVCKHLIQPFFYNRELPFVKELIQIQWLGSLAFTRKLLARLNENEILCIAGDGAMGHKFISVEFLGELHRFSTGMISLARVSGATILPLFCIQDVETGSSLTIEPPISIEIDGDRDLSPEKSIREFAALLESYVMKFPNQYRNWDCLARPNECLEKGCSN